MADKVVIKELFDPEELDLMIQGTRTLDFEQLKKVSIYAHGFTPDSELVKWFWDIVIEEYNDSERRQLLTFATGSDRAPINGLKAMKFYIVRDGDDSEKLPTSHTCFNQLLIPSYNTKEKLRTKLRQAIDNATGFGMV